MRRKQIILGDNRRSTDESISDQDYFEKLKTAGMETVPDSGGDHIFAAGADPGRYRRIGKVRRV